jgi:membrane complex biogenesis BtpA family protein
VKSWIHDLFGVEKPIIGMCHLYAMPGDPKFNQEKGMEWVVDCGRKDLLALQNGGVDAVMFSNEFSLPYLTEVPTVTVAAMARVITELKPEIKIPFGVNVLWDPTASLDLAVTVDARFVREIFTGAYASDFGIWNTNCGRVVRHQYEIGARDVRLLFNIVPESASYLSERKIADIARSTVFNTEPDALCVSGLTAGSVTSSDVLLAVKEAVPEVPVFANTGVKLENVSQQLSIADGAVVGSTFKESGNTWNPVDEVRVRDFMNAVFELRSVKAHD